MAITTAAATTMVIPANSVMVVSYDSISSSSRRKVTELDTLGGLVISVDIQTSVILSSTSDANSTFSMLSSLLSDTNTFNENLAVAVTAYDSVNLGSSTAESITSAPTYIVVQSPTAKPSMKPTNMGKSEAAIILEVIQSADAIVYAVPPILIIGATYIALSFRSIHKDKLNQVSNAWMALLTSVVASLSWIGVIHSFYQSAGSSLLYDEVNIAFLSISKTFNIFGWCYVMYHFAFTRYSPSGNPEPTLFFLLHEEVMKSSNGWVSGKVYFSLIVVAALFDPSILKLLPWKRTSHTAQAEGYPSLKVIYGCLHFPLAGMVFQTIGTLMLLISRGENAEFITSLILFILSVLLTIYHGTGVFVMVFLVKIDTLQHLVVVNVNDALEANSGLDRMDSLARKTSRTVSTNSFGIQLSTWLPRLSNLDNRDSHRSRHGSTMNDSIDTTSNPLHIIKELKEELEIERRLRLASETYQRAVTNKQETLTGKLATIETEQSHVQKDLDILSSQLNRHGLQALRYMPLDEIRGEMQLIFNQINEGNTHYDERRLDYLLACLEINPDYIREKQQATKAWVQKTRVYIDDCYQTMLGFVPPNIFQITFTEMLEEGLPKAIANRLKNKQCLWLIRLDRGDLQKLHEAMLLGRFNPDGQNLDIVELAAVYAALPETFLNDPFGKKIQWKEKIEESLKKMVTDKQNGQLSKSKERFSGYLNAIPPYVGRQTMHTLNAVKAAENIG
jgi:hypothetical protein